MFALAVLTLYAPHYLLDVPSRPPAVTVFTKTDLRSAAKNLWNVIKKKLHSNPTGKRIVGAVNAAAAEERSLVRKV